MKRAFVVSLSLSLAIIALMLGLLDAPGTPVSAQGIPIINTVAGGGFTSSVPAKQAPMTEPSVTALDPSIPPAQGFGLYVVDKVKGRTVIRFVNGTQAPLVRAGITIQPGHIAHVAGGGDDQEQIDGEPARLVDLVLVTGMVVDPSGKAIYLNLPDLYRAIIAINVDTQNFVIGGKTILPGRVGGLVDTGLVFAVGLVKRGNDFYVAANPFTNNTSTTITRFRLNDNPLVIAGGGSPPEGTGNGGQATQAKLLTPLGIAFDSEDNLIIAEAGSGRTPGSIRKVTSDTNINEVVGGLNYPIGLSPAADGSFLVPLGNDQQVARVTTNGSLTIVAGDSSGLACAPNTTPTCADGGPALSAKFNMPGSESQKIIQLAADATGFFIPDANPQTPTPYAHIRYVNTSGGAVTKVGTQIPSQGINSIVGTDKIAPYDQILATHSDLNGPRSVGVTAEGNVFIADTLNDRLRFVNRGGAPITIFSGTPSAQTVQPSQIVSVNFNVGQPADDDRVSNALFNSIQGIHVAANGVYIADELAGVRFPNSLNNPNSGLIKFINTSGAPVNFYPGAAPAQRITVNPGEIKVIAGLRTGPGVNPNDIGDNGPALMAVIFPADVAVDVAGNIYVADYEATRTNRVRRIDAGNGTVTTLYGDGSPQLISKPTGIAIDGTGRVVVADTFNNRILRQNTAGGSEFSIIANQSLGVDRPRDVAVAPDGTIVVTSTANARILRITAPGNALGTAVVLGGTGAIGFSGDGGPADAAQIALDNQLQNDIHQETVGITVHSNGAVLFADTNNGRIRQIFDEPPGLLVSISAASFAAPGTPVATESIVAGFGQDIAPQLAVANTFPLPFNILGTSVDVRDSAQTTRQASLFAVAPGQVNYLIPPGTVNGQATVTVRTGAGKVLQGNVQIVSVQPGLFSVSADGAGIAAGQFQRYTSAGLVGTQDTFQISGQSIVLRPVAFGPADELLFLILYGTGIRHNMGLAGVTVTIGGANGPVTFAGPQGVFVGEDQLNIGPLPRSLAGAGPVNVVLTVEGKQANTLQVAFQ
jgi:uncharacterized protein (TIGR03437 family)